MTPLILFALALPALGLAQTPDRRQGRVVLDAEQDASTYDEQAREIREREIAMAREMLTRTDLSASQRADLMLRLGDLYFQKGREAYLDEMLDYQQRVDACFDAPPCDPQQLQPDHGTSRALYERSLRLYGLLLDNYASWPRSDEAAWYLASGLLDLDRDDEAIEVLVRLVREYPDSRFAPDAYLQIGDYWFDEQADPFKALLAYRKASAFRSSERYPYALYKQAWALYNVGEPQAALDTMKQVLAWSDRARELAEESGGEARGALDLAAEAKRDLVRFCAEAGTPEECYALFRKRGELELVSDTMRALADTYVQNGRPEDAVLTWRRLIAEAPDAPDAARHQAAIVGALVDMGRVDEALAELQRMRRDHGPGSAWAQRQSAHPEVVEEADAALRRQLLRAATAWHQEARKLRAGERAEQRYAAADRLYRLYLDDWPEGKQRYQVLHDHAELLWATGRAADALDTYEALLELNTAARHAEFAARSAVHAARRLLEQSGELGEEHEGREPVALSEVEARSLAALDRHAELFPDSEHRKAMLYEAAWLLYAHNHFAASAERFRAVIALDPRSREATLAARLILDQLALVEDWEALEQTATAFAAPQGPGTAAFREEARQVATNARFKQAEVLADTERLAGAEAFRAFADAHPQDPLAPSALHNAALYFAELQQRERAMEARQALLERHPDAPRVPDTLAALAFDHESLADFDRAAELYGELVARFPDHPHAADAAWSQAVLAEAMGDPEEALEAWTAHITLAPEDPRRLDAELRVATLHHEAGRAAQALKVLEGLEDLDLEQALFVGVQRVALLEELERSTQAQELRARLLDDFDQARAAGEPLEGALDSAASLRAHALEQARLAFEPLELSGPADPGAPRSVQDRVLAAQLEAKVQGLAAVEEAAAAVLDTGSGRWGVEALVTLGAAYEDMAETLESSFVPTWLSEEQAFFYRGDLHDEATRQRLKAIAAYEAALGKAHELSLYGPAAQDALQRLNELDPARYPATWEQRRAQAWTAGGAPPVEPATELE